LDHTIIGYHAWIGRAQVDSFDSFHLNLNGFVHGFIISSQPLKDMSPSPYIHMHSHSSYHHDDESRLSTIHPICDTKSKSFITKYRGRSEPAHASGSPKWLNMIKASSGRVVCKDQQGYGLQNSWDHQEYNHDKVHPTHAPPIPDRIYIPTEFPIQMRPFESDFKIPPSVPDPDYSLRFCETVGNPSFNIHRLRLPPQFLPILEYIVNGCERYAQTLPQGWNTDLYSLTKQDIALRDIPELYASILPILSYIKKVTMMVYGVNALRMDRNQPHVLKYKWEKNGKGHTGVQLHHDKCDYTVNLMLSRSSDYQGGG